MADKSFFGRLERLFSTSTVVRKIGKNKLKVIDVNKVQGNSRLATNRLVDRFNKLHTPNSANTTYNQYQNFQTQRLSLFTDYESMDEDSIISSALDIYADESTMKNEYGNVLNIKSDNEEIHDVLHNLFYDILNIEFNLWPWIRNMCKYGDQYLKFDITEKLGITGVTPISTYEMVRAEGTDEERPDYVKFIHDMSMGGNTPNQSQQTEYENYEVGHFRLLSDANFLPYGKSMLEGARKNWKQLTLMEDAMMIHRIMRAPEKRVFKIDIGNIPPSEVDNYMQKVINKMKKVPYVDPQTGQYNLKFNMQNMMEDYYMPIRGGQSGTEIDTLSGMEFGGIDDIEYLRNRMFAALKIPKAFLGYDETTEGKATLAAEDVRFARTIERIQRIVVSELTKIAVIHLYSQGYDNEKLADFSLELTNSSMIYQQEKISLWSEKISLADSIKDNKMLSENWIYEKIFDLSKEEIEKERANVIEDSKQVFRKEQIESEGQDPANPPEGPQEENEDDFSFEESEIGRPPEGIKYGNQDHIRGRDPLGSETRDRDARNKDRSIKHKFNGSALARESYDTLIQTMKKSSLLNENNLIKDESLSDE